MNQKLIMLKGLPGSGKSTWAKQMSRNNQQYVRVNKDDIRAMIGYTPHREEMVLRMRDLIITSTLQAGKNIIVDDTNFHPKHEPRLRELAELVHAEFEIKFFDTPLKECIANDLKRPVSVGEAVIRRMHNQYLAKIEPKKNWQIGLPKAVIVDIDGTVALHTHRGPYDTSRYCTDEPNKPIVAMVQEFMRQGFWVLFTSGRDAAFRDVTSEWLQKHVIVPVLGSFKDGVLQPTLIMRPEGDRREDSIVKQELYEKYIKGKCNVFVVLDDRTRVVDMWRRMGLTCLQVANGDF